MDISPETELRNNIIDTLVALIKGKAPTATKYIREAIDNEIIEPSYHFLTEFIRADNVGATVELVKLSWEKGKPLNPGIKGGILRKICTSAAMLDELEKLSAAYDLYFGVKKR